jgi:putative endonuclease
MTDNENLNQTDPLNLLFAKSLAGFWLRIKGYQILARDYLTPEGSIDLIVRKGKELVFVKVVIGNTDTERADIRPLKEDQRLKKAIEFYYSQNLHHKKLVSRLDLAIASPPFFIKHLANA